MKVPTVSFKCVEHTLAELAESGRHHVYYLAVGSTRAELEAASHRLAPKPIAQCFFWETAYPKVEPGRHLFNALLLPGCALILGVGGPAKNGALLPTETSIQYQLEAKCYRASTAARELARLFEYGVEVPVEFLRGALLLRW